MCAAVGCGCDGWAKGRRLVGRGFGMGVGRQGTVAECSRAGAVRNVRCGSRQAHGAEGWRSLREPRRTQRREERPLSQALTGGCGSCCFLHMGCWHFLRRNVSSSRGSFLLGVSHHGLLRPCIFRLPRSVLCLGGPRTESGSSRPFLMSARSGVRLRSVSDRGVSVCSKRFACARQMFLVFRRRFSVFHNRF